MEDEKNGKTTVAVNALFIDKGKLLLVRPKGKMYWYPPGGKLEQGETDVQGLFREVCGEELPKSMITRLQKFKTFVGETPSSLKNLVVITYLVDMTGSFLPGAEIEEVAFVQKPEDIYLTHTTRDIVASLREQSLLF